MKKKNNLYDFMIKSYYNQNNNNNDEQNNDEKNIWFYNKTDIVIQIMITYKLNICI